MNTRSWSALLAVAFLSAGCDYWDWLHPEPEPEPGCRYVRCGDERVEICDDSDRRVRKAPARGGWDDEDCGWGGSPNFHCNCPDVWEPVCDANGNVHGNRCEARCAEAGPVVRCGGPFGLCGCGRVWAPVCDADGNVYTNRCEARCHGAGSVFPCDGNAPPTGGVGGAGGEPGAGGAPGHGAGGAPGDAGCPCPRLWEPVCDADGTRYANRCIAACKGATSVVDC